MRYGTTSFQNRTKQTREQSTLDVDDELFEVQGYLKDFFDVATELDSYEISAFQKNYQQAMAYYVEHGDLAVNTKSGSLGQWISIQRKNYKNHKLSEERFEALNAIGMIWNTSENQIAVETLCEENGISSEELWQKIIK